MRKVTGSDAGQLYAMKVLKKATLKGKSLGRDQLLLSHTLQSSWEFAEIQSLLGLHGFGNRSQRRAPGP